MIGRKAGHHLGRAVRPLIYEYDDLSMKRLWAEALGKENQGFVSEGEARQGKRQRRPGVRHRDPREFRSVIPSAKTPRGQAVADRNLPRAQVAGEPREVQAASDVSSQIDDEAFAPLLLKTPDRSVQRL